MPAHIPLRSSSFTTIVYCTDATCERSIIPRLENMHPAGRHYEACDATCRENAFLQREADLALMQKQRSKGI